MKYQSPKLFVGPVSKNTVDAVIEYANEYNVNLGLIPSRRQVDWNGGYVNGWNTESFVKYVKSKTNLVVLQRDHGGPGQGKEKDDGEKSFLVDNEFMDLIHIDPWKTDMSSDDCIRETIYWLNRLDNPNVMFEIGTEQAIRPLTVEEVDHMIHRIHKSVPTRVWLKIFYLVVQSGTALLENKQIGKYNERNLIEFVKSAKFHLFYTKEHNGDYLPTKDIKHKFDFGLDSINLAPEFGMIETNCFLKEIKHTDPKLIHVLYKMCYESNTWTKWVDKHFDVKNEERLIKICCHYLFSTPEFEKKILRNLRNIDVDVKSKMKERIHEIVN